ncbi:MAG: MarR family winged helix-turn-helix transcriptional regulator [Thalassovita sp.]
MLTRYLMAMTQTDQIRFLIKRLARLDAAETWDAALNPAQIAALEYLARANRFSRAPSHVADYLGTTRGTMSQTLKALARKGYVSERRSETDKRSISYDLNEAGRILAARRGALAEAINTVPEAERAQLSDSLSELLEHQLRENGGRSFGICRTCAHHRVTQNGAFCALLSLPLLPDEPEQICHEQVAA